MQAIIHDTYGPIETLERREIAPPTLGDHDVLVRVRAAGLHVGDLFAVRGSPFLVRLATGIRRPKYGVPGFDLAGTVVDIGNAVTRFKAGDDVFGVGEGTAAELSRAREDLLVALPSGLTFEEAAAIPTSGLAALHGLRDAGNVRPGQKVLINGASGGVGTFAVQIAKALGAHVTGVAGRANLELIRSLGANEAIDYTRDDFTERAAAWDVILDNVENRTLADVRRALTPTGTLVLNSGTGASGLRMLIRLVTPILRSAFSAQHLRRYISNPNQADLTTLAELVQSGKLRPVVGRTYALDETVDALRHIATGHARGKVVLTMSLA